jgi:hypothetical protein
MVYSSFERVVGMSENLYGQFSTSFSVSNIQCGKESKSVSFENAKENKVDLEGFTDDAFLAAASLADLALSGATKCEVKEQNAEQSNEEERSREKGTDVEMLSTVCDDDNFRESSAAVETCQGSGGKERSATEPLISKYDDSSQGGERGVAEELQNTGNAMSKGCEEHSSFRMAQSVDFHLNSSSLTFERSESDSDDSFCREVGLKEKSRGMDESSSSPIAEGEEEEEEEEDNTDEGEERTRCPCGRVENFGTMIQCDDCKVWQHAKCVGFRKLSEIPEHYFCEECRPDQVRENSILYKKKSSNLKRSRKMNRSRAELERQERMIENSEVIRSEELKNSFCKDLKKKYETSPKTWNESMLFKKYLKYLKENEGERESVIAGLVIVSGLSSSEVEEKLNEHEKESSSAVEVKDEYEESRLEEPNTNSVSMQEKVKKRKRTSILNSTLDIGDKVASSREERKMQQILLQFKKLEEREEKRKHKSSGNVGSTLSLANSDDNLSARFRKSSHRTTSIDSDEKYSSPMMEGDDCENNPHRSASIRDCLSTSSREMDDLKLEERIWEEESLVTPFHNLPGPSIVGSTLFSLDASPNVTSNSLTESLTESVSRLQGFWKKEKLLKLFREKLSVEQEDGLHSLMFSKPRETMLLPVKKKLLMDADSCLLSPASSSGVKTGISSTVECGDTISSTLMNMGFADDSKALSPHTLSGSKSCNSLSMDDVAGSMNKSSKKVVPCRNDSAVLKSGESIVKVNSRGLEDSPVCKGVYNTSVKMGGSRNEVEVDSAFSSNRRQDVHRDFVNTESSHSRWKDNNNHEVADNSISSASRRNVMMVGSCSENSRSFPAPSRIRKSRFHPSARQWSPNKKPRRNLDAWRDFRKQNGWH